MVDSRGRILTLLEQHHRATVGRLAQEMGQSSASVRRHLDILQRDQLVAFQREKRGTGRPEHVYRLTEAGQALLPKGYDRLLERLLRGIFSLPNAEFGSLSSEELLQFLFGRMAQETAEGEAPASQEPLLHRVTRLAAILEREQFSSEITEESGAIRICLRNCPFRSAALGTAPVCSYDQMVISTVLGRDVVMERCIRDGDDDCLYLASAVAEGV
jgi:predicted ArsR family transcriptional regulator